MEVCVNGNGSTPSFEWSTCQPAQPSTARPKRDFRFQVIEVRQHPKWFIWPSRNRGNDEEVDENHNKTQNGYGTKRRNVLRGSKRMQMEKDGVPGRTASEPARRLSTKKDKTTTEPLASGGLSNTFKILSIAKKWDSFDATDDESDDATMSCDGVNKMAKGDCRWTAK
ncbi:unnamed protein product [Angiostrongylus costaricensis]|uniref:Uncharacterized protein n=1 Tax=Angiostrongylus costaricensis TaxID=334426 RepID=A0A0R3PWX9_ANGCS|nr:unnamed protein product [Angiostrongylus costaricensis]